MNTKHREGKAKGDIQLTVEIHEFELCESTHIQIFFFCQMTYVVQILIIQGLPPRLGIHVCRGPTIVINGL